MTTPNTVHDLQRAADELERLDIVRGTDVFTHPPTDGPPIAEVTIGPSLSHVPVRILRQIAERDCGLSDVSRRPGGHFVLVLV